VDLREQLLGMQEMLQRSLRGDVEVKMSFGEALWPVEVDPSELELAILNLCVNARDAMPEGGTISISARNASAAPAAAAAETVVVAVADTGVGMAQDVLAHAFEPFFTTKEVGRGSGLGLAQVYGFIVQSNGQVALESAPGKGTTVLLTFPRSERQLTAANMARSTAKPPAGLDRHGMPRGSVLLVEDDATVAALSGQMLENIGLVVTHVKSASDALEALSTMQVPDIVFSDVMMPGGMNGVELAREIRRRWPNLPVVLTTGYIEAARSAVMEGLEVLVKPYALEVLARTLNAHLPKRVALAR
jgi:CheY-like chemotaxis protein